MARGEAAVTGREEGQAGLGPPHPHLDLGPGLTVTIRQVLGLHEVRFQHLKAHEHLGQQHHQVDLEVEGRVRPQDPQPWMPSSAYQAPKWPYLEGRWHIKQVLKGQWAATRKAGGTEILHELEVVQAVRHGHGVLEAHFCRDRMPGTMGRRRGPQGGGNPAAN